MLYKQEHRANSTGRYAYPMDEHNCDVRLSTSFRTVLAMVVVCNDMITILGDIQLVVGQHLSVLACITFD